MNTGRLRELIGTLLALDKKTKTPQRLAELLNALNQLQSSPQDPARQTEVASKISELREALSKLEAQLTPAELQRLDDLGGRHFFTPAIVDRLLAVQSENQLTPAVVQNECQQISGERSQFIAQLSAIETAFQALGIDYDEIPPGEAEIGFELPRAIFDNELGKFAAELKELRFIIRAFSEVAGNSGEQIEVRQLSTTDPLILIGLGILTVRELGSAVSWSLDQWKKLEEIRHIRTQTAALAASAHRDEAVAIYDRMIDASLTDGAKEEAKELAAKALGDEARKNELETHLERALIQLLARIERGMTVELRLGPPPVAPEAGEAPEGEGGETEATGEALAYQEVKKLSTQLVFPTGTSEPILSIERKADQSDPEGSLGAS